MGAASQSRKDRQFNWQTFTRNALVLPSSVQSRDAAVAAAGLGTNEQEGLAATAEGAVPPGDRDSFDHPQDQQQSAATVAAATAAVAAFVAANESGAGQKDSGGKGAGCMDELAVIIPLGTSDIWQHCQAPLHTYQAGLPVLKVVLCTHVPQLCLCCCADVCCG